MAENCVEILESEKGTDLCRVRGEGGIFLGFRKDILTENLTDRESAFLVCTRCQGILREVCMSSSGEQLCSCCTKEEEQTHPNIHVRNTVLSLKCSCPLYQRGCEWLGTLGECENHLDVCGHVHETCKLGCKIVLPRHELFNHANEKCNFREIPCEHCKGDFKVCDMPNHLSKCDKMPLTCDVDLLVDSLSPLEVQLLVCTKCNGIMSRACQVGEDQLHMCEACMNEGDEFQPMKLSRNSIPGLKSKCPLDTRGCMWSGPLVETEAHLDECQEFVINCPNECAVIIKRCELETHLTECKLLKVECEHCGLRILNSELEEHHEECLDIQIACPNECPLTLKRCESEDHVVTDCPNTLINCPFMSFGCDDLVKRGELDEHKQTNESKHTQLQLNFALSKISSMEEDRKKVEKQYAEDVAELKDRLDNQEETIIGLEQEKSQLSSKLQTNRKGSANSLTGSFELLHDSKRYSSPSLNTPSPSLEDQACSIVIKNIGSTVEFKNIISSFDKVVIHFFDNSSVSQAINLQYNQSSTIYPNIKFCQANVSNDRGMLKVAGVKYSHEIHFYNQGVKMSVLRWKDQESFGSALYNLDTI